MEILHQFGFDVKLFAAQIVNFLVIAYVFKRFLYKPILETLKKRNDMIARGVKDAEKATLALEKAEEQKEEILAKAQKEAEKILEEARTQSQQVRDDMMSQTKAEVEKLMLNTHQQIELERENFKKEAKDVSLEIARKVLEQSIVKLFDKKDDDILIKKGIQNIKNG